MTNEERNKIRQEKIQIRMALLNAMPVDVDIATILLVLGELVSEFARLLWTPEEEQAELAEMIREELKK